ncbi:MAG: phenylalanine--tRNA ligase subunit alpha [Thermoplasmata archaeon]|nr:phenylalanine--tRNA ligase subunit alpha [Thermoplasmata archaeon]
MAEEEGIDFEADSTGAPLTLSSPERKLLEALRLLPEGDTGDEEDLSRLLSLPIETVRGTLQRLRSKHLAVVEEEHLEERHLSPRGERAVAGGLPERRLLSVLDSAGGVLPVEPSATGGLSEEERSAAVGILRRRGYLAAGIPFRLADGHPDLSTPFPEEAGLRVIRDGAGEVDAAVLAQLKKRGLITIDHRSTKHWAASAEGRRLPLPSGEGESIGALTPQLLSTGEWKAGDFRPYDVRAPVPFLTGARPHPYLAWLREFEEILIGLGFEQSEGPLLETEFWNADVLFMPQEHPARSIHDVLTVRGVRPHPPPADLLARVAEALEGRPMPGESVPITPGWRSPYDPEVARRPVLRSQTTAVSARFLSRHPTPPFRMFCLDRNFRRDAVDATHHVEFAQCEGILGGEGVSLRDLVGVFRELAAAIGIRELKIRPSYFPFTEPSIEGYVKHPRLGWIEVFPGGLFRPEVLRPLGIDVPVAAWGIGITRLAMISLGLSDIRDLFLDDLDRLTGRSM